DPGLGLGSHSLGLGFCAGDDVLRFAFGGRTLSLVFGEQLRSLVFKLAGLVELSLDARRPVIERLVDHSMHAEIAKDADEQHEGKGHPGFRLHQHRYEPFSASATAAATTFSLGASPIRRSTIARVASSAMLRTLPMAACFVAVMGFFGPPGFGFRSFFMGLCRAPPSPPLPSPRSFPSP